MLVRILTSAIGLVVFFTLLFVSSSTVPIICAICAVIGVMLFEVYRSINSHKALNCAGFIAAILILVSIISAKFDSGIAISLPLILYMMIMVFLHGVVGYKEIMSHCILTYYITFFMGSLITVRVEYGVFSLLFVFICAWLTDTGAYFIGVFLGRHKLIPKVSPKKTVEGAIGGVVACVAAALIYVHVLKLVESSNIVYTIVFAVIVSVLSQFGDLAASSIKRDCNIKDFGNLLPGHGGLTDRFDSVMFITPIVLYLMKFM